MSSPEAAGTVRAARSAASAPLLEVAALSVMLTVNGIRRPVLRDVSLTVAPGEAVGLVGESGAGKTMTVRAIGRLLPAGAQVQGSIRFGGTAVGGLSGADLRRYRAQVAMIFQDPPAAGVPASPIVLRRGTVVERGPTAQVLDNPGHPYTQQLRAGVPRPGWKPKRLGFHPNR